VIAPADTDALVESMARGLHSAAERGERALVSTTIRLDADVDPAAIAIASRLASDRWFCWEQPESGFALAGLGVAEEALSRGAGRFGVVVDACADAGRRLLADQPDGMPAGAGPVWVGGFAFAADGGGESHWSSFAPALMTMPELAIVRSGDEAYLTVCAVSDLGRDRDPIARVGARLAALREQELPMLDPSPVGKTTIKSVRSPRTFQSAVKGAVERIRNGELEKVVLAREVLVTARSKHDPAPLFGAIREAFPSCFCFCCGTPEAAFLGASPELLIRRRGATAASVALAGSTRRSADPAVDDHLGEELLHSDKDRSEQAIVVRGLERALRPYAVWVQREPEPELVKVLNIQHLATPIHALLAEPRSAVELAGLLHPTPAVAGEPRQAAEGVIDELEKLDRGWYAGPVGWMDAAEDGDFCVALRSALLRDRTAHLYAGVGVVADSDPAAELAETELKLEALLPLLTG
jgi:menaquinone-specific isochorismate synthase